jgi:GDPmannose 4,6-dehydratase
MTSKKALITGITGMDGKLLSSLLLLKGYTVYGLYRNNPNKSLVKIDNVTYIESDLSNLDDLKTLFGELIFDEIYNLGGQTFIGFGWEHPEYTIQVNCLSVIKFLEYIKNYSPNTKFFNASSSEIFADTKVSPQNELTLHTPNNMYGSSKSLSSNIIKNYREYHNVYSVSGILYTHEDVSRDEYYVSKKITSGVAKIHLGLSNTIYLGDLNSSRDWLSAKDVVNAMWYILQENKPDDYIISSGISRTIKEFISTSFNVVGINNWHQYVKIDNSLIRQEKITNIVGDNTKLTSIGWKPIFSFQQMIEELVTHEIKKLKN